MAKHLILCDCLGSQRLDAKKLSEATGLRCSRVHTALCTRELAAAEQAIATGEALIACQQEADRFTELAEDLGAKTPLFTDLRDRAGWSDDTDATAKMAALIAEALLPAPPSKTIDIQSGGACLIIGASGIAQGAAETLARVLAVTVLVTDEGDVEPIAGVDHVRGRLRRATGSLGRFELHFDGLQQLQPGGRGTPVFEPPRDGARTDCDLIVDLSGEAPLFPAPHKRDGYLRADPGDPRAVAAVLFEAAQHVGTFEKPLHVRLDPLLCAHSRAGQTGCSRCLDNCPTGAITPDGDAVSVDPMICAGCGACSSLCPSGAISYDAPPVSHHLRRMQILAETYANAGGKTARLLVHDDGEGAEMIRLAARHGRGLPADVIPLEVQALTSFGHSEMLAALAFGLSHCDILLSPKTEAGPLQREVALAQAMGAAGRLGILDLRDPDALSDHLYGQKTPAAPRAPVLMMGNRRQVARLAAKALNPGATEVLPLPEGAPYGAVVVDTGTCTLCLSCASLCPTGAIVDNPDKPQLRFQEDACLQCGICATVCPENAIRLDPRFDPGDSAMKQRILHEEEPACCVECGAAFGVKSTIDKIVEKLAGKHAMFSGGDAERLIRMCDNCRIQAQYHSQNSPFAGGERPRVRTTDDYLSKRRDH